jgi:hypothetical protein
MKRMKQLGAIVALGALVVTGLLVSPASAATNGTWAAYPGQATTYQTSVQAPINADGSSNYKVKSNAVIPVKFALSQGTGAFTFESIYSDTNTDNDYSFLSFTPSSTVLFKNITELSSQYAFTTGNCHGGSLRWSVRVSPTQSVFIYYGDYPNFTDCSNAATGSGANLINLSDLRYDTSQVGGTFYDNYAGAVALVGDDPILRASLVLDSGWAGDQRLTLTSATLATSGFSDTFTPQPSSAFAPVCPTETATIKVTKTDNSGTGDVNEVASIQPQDSNGVFRIVDCKYMYNLATTSLTGTGTYKVYAVINGVTATPPAVFDLK